MIQPRINLDGTLNKRTTLQTQRTGEGQPGCYSPRGGRKSSSPSTDNDETSTSLVASAVPCENDAQLVLSETMASCESAAHSCVSAAHGATPVKLIGVSDPELETAVAPPSRTSGGDCFPSEVTCHPQPQNGVIVCSGSRSAVLKTLVEHHAVHQLSISRRGNNACGDVVAGANSKENMGEEKCTSPVLCEAPVLARDAENALTVRHVSVEEAYIDGRPFEQCLRGLRQSETSYGTAGTTATSAANSGGGTLPFQQHPAQYISSIAASATGEYVAVGDRSGRVTVLKRPPMTEAQRALLLDAVEGSMPRAYRLPNEDQSVLSPARQPYKFHTVTRAYTSVIDPLNSVEVAPNITALAFLSDFHTVPHLLTANEKVPKLFKVTSSPYTSRPFRMVDQLDCPTIGSLCSSSGPTVATKLVSQFALNHEYTINSLCPLTDSAQFVSSDDLTMHLWCTEYPDTSIETYSMRPPYDEEPKEAIRCVRCFPQEPSLLFVATSAGMVRVVDIRQGLKWMNQTPLTFFSPPRVQDGSFSNVTNSLSDVALSPCSRYVVGRDFMSVCLWDVRMAGRAHGGSASERGVYTPYDDMTYSTVGRWELHPHLYGDLETLYQSDLLFERFDIQFVSAAQVCTGGFRNVLYMLNIDSPARQLKGESSCTDVMSSGLPSPGVEVLHLPALEGASGLPKCTVEAEPAVGSCVPSKTLRMEGDTALELGSRVTLLSRPIMSHRRVCGLLVSCGQVMMQLSYKLPGL